jgi:hypothetical protein
MMPGRVRFSRCLRILVVAAAILSGCTTAPATAPATIALPTLLPTAAVTPATPVAEPSAGQPSTLTLAGPMSSASPSPSPSLETAVSPQPACSAACRDALSRVTLYPEELPGSFEVFDHEPAFGFSTFPELLGSGTEGASFSFSERYTGRIIFGSTVFLSGSSDRETFDRATAAPDRFLEDLFAGLGVKEVAYTASPSYQQTETGSSVLVSGTCLFRGTPEVRAFDVSLYRDGILGVAIFYLYGMGDARDPDINALTTMLKQKIAMALDLDSAATLQPYFVETATPHRSAPIDAVEVLEPRCGVSFKIPHAWEAVELEDSPVAGGQCSWGIRQDNWDAIVAESKYMIGEYAFSVAVLELPLEEAAWYGYFELVSGQWYVSGRQGALTPASAVQDRGLTILRGTGLVGLHDLHGGYVGIADLPRAVASDGVHSAVLEAGPVKVEPAFELLLQTLRFLE